jgi:hypothetical protein
MMPDDDGAMVVVRGWYYLCWCCVVTKLTHGAGFLTGGDDGRKRMGGIWRGSTSAAVRHAEGKRWQVILSAARWQWQKHLRRNPKP